MYKTNVTTIDFYFIIHSTTSEHFTNSMSWPLRRIGLKGWTWEERFNRFIENTKGKKGKVSASEV